MKYLIGLMFLMLVKVAGATECRINGGNWIDVATRAFNVYADVRADISMGKIFLDGFTLECRHGLLTSFPFNGNQKILTSLNTVRFSINYDHLKGGLWLNGYDYPNPVKADYMISHQTTEPHVRVPGNPYINIQQTPGTYVQIKSGANVAQLVFTALSYSAGALVEKVAVVVNVYANNSLNMSPSTCTINNNNPINVDFGSVDPLAVGGDISAGTPYRRSVVLNYSCPEAGIDSPIDIKLLGTASSFNSSALATSNPDLAAGLTRLSSLVAPGSSFRTSITNSSGRDTVLFTLFRKTGSLPVAGPFTASGTLVMSVP